MATLLDIYALIAGSPELEQRFVAARMKAAWYIVNLATPGANELAWAKSLLADPHWRKRAEFDHFLSNGDIQADGSQSSDATIEYVVNALRGGWADDAAAS